MKNLDCICFGSIILDYRKRLIEKRYIKSQPLQLTDKPINFKVGGISILAMALKGMGFNTAVVGLAGKDIIGYGLKTYLKENCKINTEGLKLADYSTSYSIINLTDKERYIQHNIGANAFLKGDIETIRFITKNRPTLVAIGYSGLLPGLDRNKGTEMAKFMTALISKGIKTALDIHTMPKDYSMINKPLRAVDIFFCNAEEGKRISGEVKPEKMMAWIINFYPMKNSIKYRVFGITLPDGVYIAYGKKGLFDRGLVKSHWYTDRPKDLTGAGDAFRAGFYAYLIRNITSFDQGAFDWRKAGRLSNFIAATIVKEGMGGIKNYAVMLARSNL